MVYLEVVTAVVYDAVERGAPSIHQPAQAAGLYKESDFRFNRALDLLQADFEILPVGVAEAGEVEIRLHLRPGAPLLSRSA